MGEETRAGVIPERNKVLVVILKLWLPAAVAAATQVQRHAAIIVRACGGMRQRVT